MAPKSQTWSGQDTSSQAKASDFRKSSLSKFLHLPLELRTLTHKVFQPSLHTIEVLFRRKSSPSGILTAPTRSCNCSEIPSDQDEVGLTLEAQGEAEMTQPRVTQPSSADPPFPWPPIAHSTEEPLIRYHSFPEPKFSGDGRRASWIQIVLQKARLQVQELWRKDVPRNLLRRKPVNARERDRFNLVVVEEEISGIESEEEVMQSVPQSVLSRVS